MKKFVTTLLFATAICLYASAQSAMQNILGRECVSLNGEWNTLPDPFANGMKNGWGKPKPQSSHSLSEVYYEEGETLKVPGDWNHQNPHYFYYEGDMWYKKSFNFTKKEDKRTFLHFGAVSMSCNIFLNGEEIGSHRGGFTPFQIEVSDKLLEGENYLIVRVDCKRSQLTIPALNFDWWNYGGITRDVDLVYVPKNYIFDYTVGLKDNRRNMLNIEVQLNGEDIANKEVTVAIAEAKVELKLTTDAKGYAQATQKAKLKLWDCENPKLYDVTVSKGNETICDRIGFRTIEVKGEDILLNGKPIFLRGINIHEEIASEDRRSIDMKDAKFLVQQANDLGCNFIRLSHYPHNEYMVRHAEEMGMLMWEEIPIWQSVQMGNQSVRELGEHMLREMISRDKNRCGIALWSVSNETSWYKERNEYLKYLIDVCHTVDPTRLVTSALDKEKPVKEGDKYYMTLDDPLVEYLDVVGVNKYMGWYGGYPCPASELNWRVATGKPVIFSEFGSECVYGNNEGDTTNLNSWSESYMEQNYKDNIASFDNFPNLRGTSPWILFDFRSPRRPHAKFQHGWNRKGLISPEGGRKRAWYVMRDYYSKKK